MTTTYSKSTSVHRPNFPGARTIREASQMYVGEYQYVTIHTTDTTWSVFAGTLLVTEGPKPEFASDTEMYAAAYTLAEAFVSVVAPVLCPNIVSGCHHDYIMGEEGIVGCMGYSGPAYVAKPIMSTTTII